MDAPQDFRLPDSYTARVPKNEGCEDNNMGLGRLIAPTEVRFVFFATLTVQRIPLFVRAAAAPP